MKITIDQAVELSEFLRELDAEIQNLYLSAGPTAQYWRLRESHTKLADLTGTIRQVSSFSSLLRRADTLRRLDSNPMNASWWTGYMRGLRRAHHGERFGTEAEHELWLSAVDSTDPQRAALGRGYRAGLTLEPRDPE